MKVKMTTMWLQNIKPGEKKEYSDTEAPGLRLRVWPTKLSWCFVYKAPGTKRVKRCTIGPYPTIGLAEARKKARELRVLVDRGEDPAGEKKKRKEMPTFAELCDEYLEKHAIHKRTHREDKRIITRELLPRWKEFKADEVTKRDVISLLDEIVARGSPIMANRTLALVRKIFNWALSRDIIETTPCLGIKAPAPERRRERWLDDNELVAVWEAFEEEKLTGRIFKILLLTGQRKGEVQGMRWEEIDFGSATWTIPPERSKNGHRHTVPLSEPVIEILKQIPKRHDEWVFPSPCARCGHIKNLGKAHQRIKELSGVQFHIHDLRRTCATGMARFGIERIVIAKVLNHTDSSVTAIYERHGYEQEKRHALETWGAHVMRLIGRDTAKVLTLPTR